MNYDNLTERLNALAYAAYPNNPKVSFRIQTPMQYSHYDEHGKLVPDAHRHTIATIYVQLPNGHSVSVDSCTGKGYFRTVEEVICEAERRVEDHRIRRENRLLEQKLEAMQQILSGKSQCP